MPIIRLILPYPPSVNHYWLKNRFGGYRIGPHGLEFRRAVMEAVALVEGRFGDKAQRLALMVNIYQPDRRERDVGNLDKALADALGHAGLYVSDGQIDDSRYVRKAVSRHAPRVEVIIHCTRCGEIPEELPSGEIIFDLKSLKTKKKSKKSTFLCK